MADSLRAIKGVIMKGLFKTAFEKFEAKEGLKILLDPKN